MKKPLILSGKFKGDELKDEVVIVTGAGQGIGFETARSLAYLGASVVIAEIDKIQGHLAASEINNEIGKSLVEFIRTDVSKARSIKRLARKVQEKHQKVDVIINNATVAPISAVDKSQIRDWDLSYGVNLRGPVLLAQEFLSQMIKNKHGVFVGVSSEGLACMGPYESFKAAQNHLVQTIAAELEETGVIAFSIGPGFVPTATAENAVKKLTEFYGKTDDELYDMYKEHVLSIEAAGAAFAASIIFAEEFQGQEIGAKQPLKLAGIEYEESNIELSLSENEREKILSLCNEVKKTLQEQAEGWKERSVFERQWVLRDFKKNAGMTVEQWLNTLGELKGYLQSGNMEAISKIYLPLEKLTYFYGHLQELARGYVKDEEKLREELKIVKEWKKTVEQLYKLLYDD